VTPPLQQRLDYTGYVLREHWYGLPIAAVAFVAGVYFGVASGHPVAWLTAAAPLLALAGVVLGLLLSGGAVYPVNTFTVICRPNAYVEPWRMKRFADDWAMRWLRSDVGADPDELIAGATLEVVDGLVTVPGGDWVAVDVDEEQTGSQAGGATLPAEKQSRVAREKATEMGTAGHELPVFGLLSQAQSMKVEIDPQTIKTVNADSRGRVHLGPEFAGEELSVAVLNRQGEE